MSLVMAWIIIASVTRSTHHQLSTFSRIRATESRANGDHGDTVFIDVPSNGAVFDVAKALTEHQETRVFGTDPAEVVLFRDPRIPHSIPHRVQLKFAGLHVPAVPVFYCTKSVWDLLRNTQGVGGNGMASSVVKPTFVNKSTKYI